MMKTATITALLLGGALFLGQSTILLGVKGFQPLLLQRAMPHRPTTTAHDTAARWLPPLESSQRRIRTTTTTTTVITASKKSVLLFMGKSNDGTDNKTKKTAKTKMDVDHDTSYDVDGLQNAPFIFGAIVLLAIWLFSIPPDFRRARFCSEQQVLDNPTSRCTTVADWSRGIADYYNQGGRVAFDFSVETEGNIWVGGEQMEYGSSSSSPAATE